MEFLSRVRLYRESYKSAQCIIEFMKRVGGGGKIRCEALLNVLSVFPNELNKFNNTGAQMQDSIYHLTLKSHFITKFCIKTI